MTLSVNWKNNQKTLLQQCFDDRWTLDDYFILLDETYDLLTTVHDPVNVIMDFTNNTTLTADILLSGKATDLFVDKHYHYNQRRVIVVNASPLMKTLVRMARHTAPRLNANISFVATYKDALIQLSRLERSVR